MSGQEWVIMARKRLVPLIATTVGVLAISLAGGTANADPRSSQSARCSVPLDVCAPTVLRDPGDTYYARIDNSWIPQPTNLYESRVLDYARQIPPTLWEACIPVDATPGRGQGYATHVVAEASLLRLIEDPRGRSQLISALTGPGPGISDFEDRQSPVNGRYRTCLDQLAPHWNEQPAPGQADPLSTTPGWTKVIGEINTVPAMHGKPGTPGGPDCVDEGDGSDWDFTMALVIRAYGLMNQDSDHNLFGADDTQPGRHNDGRWSLFKAGVSERAWLQGSVQDVDATYQTVAGIALPETENHEWLIRTTRFLHNELLDVVYPEPSPKCINSYDKDQNFDNATNGLNGYVNGITSGVLAHDWIEYNARPYSIAQMIGLLNLYDFSTDPAIKSEAGRVLDFVSLKHASESMDNERIVPFRRRAEKESTYLYQDDTVGPMYEEWVGGLANPVFPLAGAGGIGGEMTLAASSTYRPQDWIVDLMLNPAHRDYFQHFNGRQQDEVAYGGPDFTITGGGQRTPCPYQGSVLNLCAPPPPFKKPDANDPGTIEPLVLIPHQTRVEGFDKPTYRPDDIPRYPSYTDNNIIAGGSFEENECVYPNVMCSHLGGVAIPPSLRNSPCAVPDAPRPADDPGPGGPGIDPPKITDSAYLIDGQCLNDHSYDRTCIMVYKADVLLSPATGGENPQPAGGTSYVVTHSCDASAGDAEKRRVLAAFVDYMRTTGKPGGGLRRCQFNDSTRTWSVLSVTLPPTGQVDLTGVTTGGDLITIAQSGTNCDDAHDWDGATRVSGPRGGTTFGPNISGDLTPAGGRYPVTTTALTSTPDARSFYGRPVPLTATITNSATRAGAGGNVTFYDGTTNLGDVAVTAGPDNSVHASITTSSLTAGTHRITAYYNGDATFVPSITEITHTVLKAPTNLTYTGASTITYHETAAVAATLTNAETGAPIANAPARFTLSDHDDCVAQTDGDGHASCTFTTTEQPGDRQLRVSYDGDDDFQPSSIGQPITVAKERTALGYTGTTQLANAEPARLAAALVENGQLGKAPIPGRPVTLALGSGTTQQACTASTDASGTAACTIEAVNQPLTDTATVPVTATFAEDPYYLGSAANASARLQYFTERGYGVSAKVQLPLVSVTMPPTPDTGAIRTAGAGTTTPCTAKVNTVVLTANALCENASTSLNPDSASVTSTVDGTTVGIVGLPVIAISGVRSTSVSTCAEASGTTTIGKITVAGVPITVPAGPNSVVDVAGGIRLTINEQIPDHNSDKGITVNALHLTALGGAVDVVVGSAASGIHNCGYPRQGQ